MHYSPAFLVAVSLSFSFSLFLHTILWILSNPCGPSYHLQMLGTWFFTLCSPISVFTVLYLKSIPSFPSLIPLSVAFLTFSLCISCQFCTCHCTITVFVLAEDVPEILALMMDFICLTASHESGRPYYDLEGELEKWPEAVAEATFPWIVLWWAWSMQLAEAVERNAKCCLLCSTSDERLCGQSYWTANVAAAPRMSIHVQVLLPEKQVFVSLFSFFSTTFRMDEIYAAIPCISGTGQIQHSSIIV